MLRRSKQRKIKNTLSLVLTILLICAALLRISGLDLNSFLKKSESIQRSDDLETTEDNKATDISDSFDETKRDENISEINSVKPLPNTASIYIYNNSKLDASLRNHLGKTFFNSYVLKVGGDANKDQLLSGNLDSSANTELVCIGTVAYIFYTNQLDMTTCEINLNFETYNKVTGAKVSKLSHSFNESGPGFTNAKALQKALERIHP